MTSSQSAANLLAHSVSPYLLQHRNNPVHWRPWSREALEEARATQKPILLSVGYAACHWCHVMAHESFEDDATAAVMNALFVNIKVDREERPDVDHYFMQALHALGEQGGWPLTMFLTPDGEPFWGGTYFPKAARYGRPSFVQVLTQVAQIFKDDNGRITQNATALRRALTERPTPASGGTLGLPLLDALAERLLPAMDGVNGGLGGAPKFPNAPILLFLWRAADRMRRDDIRDAVLLTLDRIAQGGIYDHLGGGFARYSVDERWLVPHFEKMLYDNAQLVELLALAYCATGQALFATRIRETIDWLTREMMTPEGAFAASLDADSEGVEGKFYVWTAAEIENVLGAADAAVFSRFYDVGAAGNWTDDHTGETITILNRLRAPEAEAATEAALARMRQMLLSRRAGRIRPGLDDKILADWNGLMITALVNAATALSENRWIDIAARAFDFIAGAFARDDRLGHAWREERLTFPGFAADYAAMIGAALALYEATGSSHYLDKAKTWSTTLYRDYRDAETGLLFQGGNRDLPARLTPVADDAVPNAHGLAAAAFTRLATASGNPVWLNRADALIDATALIVEAQPLGHAAVLNALDFRLRAAEITIAGRERGALRQAALAVPFLNRIVVEVAPSAAVSANHPAAAQIALAGAGMAFVCVGQRCSLPIADPGDIAMRVAGMAG